MTEANQNTEANNQPAGILESLFLPGVGDKMISIVRIVLTCLLIFLVVMTFVNYSIHFVILALITLCLFGSFEYLVSEVKKHPELFETKTKTE